MEKVSEFLKLEEQWIQAKADTEKLAKERALVAVALYAERTGIKVGSVLRVTKDDAGTSKEALVIFVGGPSLYGRIDVTKWEPRLTVKWRRKDGSWGVEGHKLYTYDQSIEVVGEDMEAAE